ncbi:Rsp5p-dependent ubiquitination, sorting of cargo proteins at the multivesicular body [Boothiomyces macroporosus]|uniref:Rsp5p-dependent ubiquitination, sorting of cargo proteins at the multivesicular body n=1 Tax=Boothiomyces macroporosus TaxID=261099 RepID=A0AAD5Y224_9FUNG|nr:Rsp5p-dependent ubiquitination, sorting of cargo proteins at the multivesicular body [Boothiomyces macroporosus]
MSTSVFASGNTYSFFSSNNFTTSKGTVDIGSGFTNYYSQFKTYADPQTPDLDVYLPANVNMDDQFLTKFFGCTNLTRPVKVFYNNQATWGATNGNIQDNVLVEGITNFTTSEISLDISWPIALNSLIPEISTLSNTANDDDRLNEILLQIGELSVKSQQSIILGFKSAAEISGSFIGTIGSPSSYSFYNGTYTFDQANFNGGLKFMTSNNPFTSCKFQNAQSIKFSNDIFNYTLSFTASSSTLVYNYSGSVGLSFTAVGSVTFNGFGAFVLILSSGMTANGTLTPFETFVYAILVSFVLLYFIYSFVYRYQQLPSRTRSGNFNTRRILAERFVGHYPPDSEAALMALNKTNRVPESMKGKPRSPTFLCLREFEEYKFETVPKIRIGKMKRDGRQTVEFVTDQECSVQTNACMKPHEFGTSELEPPPLFDDESSSLECYFEVKIISIGTGNIAIGFATSPYPPFRLPGFAETSIGYHSKDGKVYLNDYEGKGLECGEPLEKGDTLGIGFRVVEIERVGEHVISETIFYFTRNGTRIGDEFVTDGFYADKIYPTIGVNCNCKLSVAFGNVDLVFNAPTDIELDSLNEHTIVELGNYLEIEKEDAAINLN